MNACTPLNWIDAGPVTEIPAPGARQLRTAVGNIAVVHTGAGEIYALRDVCPHRGGPLSQGMVYGDKVQCPMHGLAIDLKNGEAVAPDTGCTHTYPVRIEAGRILVGIAAEAGCACAAAA